MYFNRLLSLARKFEIERGESYREGLENGTGKRDIHVEVVFADAAKLHIYVVIVVFVYQLKVLYGGLIYAPVKVKYESLHLCHSVNRI